MPQASAHKGTRLGRYIVDDKYEERTCTVCGHGFKVLRNARGRPREYDPEECKRLRSRMLEVQALLAWLRDEHGIGNAEAGELHRELYLAANIINPRGAHKKAPKGRLRGRL
jgi:hypothetical protein